MRSASSLRERPHFQPSADTGSATCLGISLPLLAGKRSFALLLAYCRTLHRFPVLHYCFWLAAVEECKGHGLCKAEFAFNSFGLGSERRHVT